MKSEPSPPAPPQESPFGVEKAEESSGFLLWQLTSLWQSGIRKCLEPWDLTHSQFVLLASIHWLNLGQEEVTQIRLSQHTKIDPMTTSTVLRTLQKKGLIARVEHSRDTRAKTVTLSPAGLALVHPAVRAVEQYDQEFFDRLGGKLGAFQKGLRTLLNPLDFQA